MSENSRADLELVATMFCDICEELDVDTEDIIRKAVLFFAEKSGTRVVDDDTTAGDEHGGPLIKCIDASGKTRKIPQASLYLSLKAVQAM